MEVQIDRILHAFEEGRLTRRELVRGLAAIASAVAALASEDSDAGQSTSTFEAVGLNHIALRVTDIARSRDFYRRHLGMSVSRETASSCFLTCGPHFVALFRGGEPSMDHYCYAVEGFSTEGAAKKLREVGIEPRVRGGRVYFDDPDGLEVQLAAPDHRA